MSKRYKHLYDIAISDTTIADAIDETYRNSERRGSYITSMELALRDDKTRIMAINHVRRYIINYTRLYHEPRIINEGPSHKEREIITPYVNEQIMHHCIVAALMPVFHKGMITTTFSSIPGRGTLPGKKKIERLIRSSPGKVKYYAKLDIKKFFASIDQDILLYDVIKKQIKDKKMMGVLEQIVRTTDTGLPLGFYTSHWLANEYLKNIDRYVVENKLASAYYRYCDDIVMFSPNKRQLEHTVEDLSDLLWESRRLTLHEDSCIYRFDTFRHDPKHPDKNGTPLDFMGFVFYRDHTIIRKRIMLRSSRITREVRINKTDRKEPSLDNARKVASYNGWFVNTDSRIWRSTYIDPYVSWKYCRKVLSDYGRNHKPAGLSGCISPEELDEVLKINLRYELSLPKKGDD